MKRGALLGMFVCGLGLVAGLAYLASGSSSEPAVRPASASVEPAVSGLEGTASGLRAPAVESEAQRTADASGPGRPDLAQELEPARGELPVLGLATVEGVIVDATGAPRLGEEWHVVARAPSGISAEAAVDPETGRFRLESAPPGDVILEASIHGSGLVVRASATLRAGTTEHVKLSFLDALELAFITLEIGSSRPPRPDTVLLVNEATSAERSGADAQLRAFGALRFDDLEPGTYALYVNDARFSPFERRGIRLGSVVTFESPGASSIELTVAGADGAALLDCTAVLLFEVDPGARSTLQLAPAREAAQSGTLVRDGLDGGAYELVVRTADGRERRRALELFPGVVARVAVVFETRGGVLGRVLDDAGQPIANAHVRLLRPAEEDDGSVSPIFASGLSSTPPTARKTERRVTTDARGTFRMDDLEAGDYLLRAERGGRATPCLAYTQPGGERFDVGTLVLPRTGTLTIRLQGVSDFLSVTDLGLAAVPVALEGDSVEAGAPEASGRLQHFGAEGVLTLDLAVGRWQGAIEIATARFFSNSFRTLHELDELVVRPGTHETITVDLTGRWPPLVVLDVHGLPEDRAVNAQLRGPLDHGLWVSRGTNTVGFSPAGTYSLRIEDYERFWALEVPGSFAVRDGDGDGTTTLRVDLPVAWGALAFVDADIGEPLPAVELELGSATPPGDVRWKSFTTDGLGERKFCLLEGAYQVRRPSDGDDAPAAALHWSLEGPLEPTVRVPAALR